MLHNKLCAGLLAVFTLFICPRPAHAPDYDFTEIEKQVKEAKALRAFLNSNGGPEVAMDNNLANCFVVQSTYYHLNPSLLPCIAVAESSLGRFYIRETNNIWGFGHGLIAFDSFCSGVAVVGETIATNEAYQAWQKDKENIRKLAFVYKGIPPYEGWVSTVKNCMEEIKK